MTKTGIGLYGTNGHQVTNNLAEHPAAEFVAVAAFGDTELPGGMEGVTRHETLDALLADARVELVSLCSPLRSEQAAHAIACMQAGRHVYAEKPCAMTEQELDAIIATARETGMQFHEMAGTVFEQPYKAMCEVVASGAIGEVVQVLAQKCYPWHAERPADENIDGGLARQVGVYIGRFVEHVAGVKIASMSLEETLLGNDVPNSACRRAASFTMTLENGGVASGVCNYLNALKSKIWGYEILRIFGTDGIVECTSEGPAARLISCGGAPEPLDLSEPSENYFDMVVASLRSGNGMPMSIEEELSPTRWVIRAKA
jgi:predicted dehydrogenase